MFEALPMIYQLEVCQHPIRARMCGFGDKDRRPVDPPPVVRLIVTDNDGNTIPESSIDHSMMIVHAGLWNEDKTEERSLVINPSTIPVQSNGPSSTVLSLNAPARTRNLMGHYTSSAYVLNDHLGQPGIYFIFQDLSVRTEGTFTLKFSFCDLKELLIRSLNGHPNSRGSVGAEAFSDSFKVYSAKKFPGMTESTLLSKAFSKQGIKIPIRKENRFRKSNNSNDNNNSIEGKVKESIPSMATSSSSSSTITLNSTQKSTEQMKSVSITTTNRHCDINYDDGNQIHHVPLREEGNNNDDNNDNSNNNDDVYKTKGDHDNKGKSVEKHI